AVEGIEDEPRYLVVVGVDERVVHDLSEGDVGKDQLGGDALALGTGGDPRQAIAGLLFVGLGEHFAQVGEGEALAAGGSVIGHIGVPSRAGPFYNPPLLYGTSHGFGREDSPCDGSRSSTRRAVSARRRRP